MLLATLTLFLVTNLNLEAHPVLLLPVQALAPSAPQQQPSPTSQADHEQQQKQASVDFNNTASPEFLLTNLVKSNFNQAAPSSQQRNSSANLGARPVPSSLPFKPRLGKV